MLIELILFEKKFKLINDKLDSLISKMDRNDEILNGLINISLGPPPDTVPEFDIVKNDPNAICNTCSSNSIQESNIGQNESESQFNANISDVSSNSIRFCLYKYTYIWEQNSRSYWAFLLNVNRRTISGFRWFSGHWVYFGIDLRKVDSFVCYR